MAIEAQRGQAVIEALAALALFGLLGTAVISVGRFQWQGLDASLATRSLAFRYALGDRASGSSHLHVGRANRAADFPGPGGIRAAALRRELGVEDRGMVRADAALRVSPHRQHGDGLILRRHTAILADAGHADSDARVQQRIATSRTAWADAARSSRGAARQAAAQLKGIDRGWGRPAPEFDWLMPWEDLVPADRLDRAGSPARRHR
jgi:hypothetical protein